MSRLFDLLAVAVVAVVVLLPKASIEAHAALDAESIELERVAALEDRRLAEPDSVEAAVELGDAYLRLGHPDWTLSTLARFAGRQHRVHLLRATAYAERLEAASAVEETRAGEKVCDAEGAACPETERIRLRLIAGPMQALVDEQIDPHKDPKRARETVSKILHATKAPTAVHTPKKP
jgi:hypothetical protein